MIIEQDIQFINFAVGGSVTAPTIIKNKGSVYFGNGYVGAFTASQNFIVRGVNLTAPIVITAHAGFIINTDNSNTNMSPVSLVETSGVVLPTTIYVKFSPVSAIPYSTNITLTSTGAVSGGVGVVGFGIADVAPVYTPATIGLSMTADPVGEIGAYFSNVLTADFQQNDAGGVSLIRIQKAGSDILPNGSSTPQNSVDNDYYSAVAVVYQAFVDYVAGPLKNYLSGNVDARAALIRNVNAPQDAESNFASATITLVGDYFIFYGPFPFVPTTSADVRGSVFKRPQSANPTFILQTGTSKFIFFIAIKSGGFGILQILDLMAGSANITTSYVNTGTLIVNDAGGTNQVYDLYVFNAGSPYMANHDHEIKIV